MDYYLIVMKWRPKFHLVAKKVSKTLVWVRFLGILSELLDEEIISSMGDMLGRTVKVDKTSLSGICGNLLWSGRESQRVHTCLCGD